MTTASSRTFVYDEAANTTVVTDSLGNPTTYRYDARRRRRRVPAPLPWVVSRTTPMCLAHRTSTEGLTAAEVDRQVGDIEAILRHGAGPELAESLREQARAVAREWLDLVVRYYNAGL